jgi:Fe-S-cluster containining protein
VPVFALGIHADYRCGRSGVCCSSGWEVPVDPASERAIRGALASGDLSVAARGVPFFRSRHELPGDAHSVFGLDVRGRCVFLESDPRACAVHRQLGPGALPPSCRQFPRVALLTPLGVFVTLSHYCPTAADLLFREDEPPAIVPGPPAFPDDEPWEGLDAREGWPPLLRPGVLLGWDGFERWQRGAVALLLRGGAAPESALTTLRARASRAAEWTPGAGTLPDWLDRVSGEVGTIAAAPMRPEDALSSWRRVVATVPEALRSAARPLGPGTEPPLAPAWSRVVPTPTVLARPVGRYLAARLFASWTAIKGGGLVAWTHSVATALDVLRVEACRACLDSGGTFDAGALREAIRRADLLLVHLARA